MKLLPLIKRYVAYRQSRGEVFQTSRKILLAFGRSAGPSVAVRLIDRKMTALFLYGHGPVTDGWFGRYGALKGFFRYAIARNHLAASPLPATLPERPPRLVPHIYTVEEVRRLLAVTDAVQQSCRTIEPVTMYMLILLLYATGLRLREALTLRRDQVDLDQSLLTVAQTKFFKTRLVPFSPQLSDLLRTYLARPAAAMARPAPTLLCSRYGSALFPDSIQGVFRRICNYAGVRRNDGAAFQPRLHDFRHTFAVNRLINWYQQGRPVQQLLPHLSVYLGHVHLASTQVYLTMTPELLQSANQRFRRYALTGRRHV